MPKQKTDPPPRQRLSREERQAQLIDIARKIVREEGTDALTLGHLAKQAGVSKPVVYDHFESRNVLLAALYRDYDLRQSEVMQAALQSCRPTLKARARVIADAYVECVETAGKEIPGVAAALAGSPEMEALRRGYQNSFIEKCREALEPFSKHGAISHASFWAMIGAADALSEAAARGEIPTDEAAGELFRTIFSMVNRTKRAL